MSPTHHARAGPVHRSRRCAPAYGRAFALRGDEHRREPVVAPTAPRGHVAAYLGDDSVGLAREPDGAEAEQDRRDLRPSRREVGGEYLRHEVEDEAGNERTGDGLDP